VVLCAVFPTADTNRTPSETVAIENMEVGKERPGYPTKIGFPCFFAGNFIEHHARALVHAIFVEFLSTSGWAWIGAVV